MELGLRLPEDEDFLWIAKEAKEAPSKVAGSKAKPTKYFKELLRVCKQQLVTTAHISKVKRRAKEIETKSTNKEKRREEVKRKEERSEYNSGGKESRKEKVYRSEKNQRKKSAEAKEHRYNFFLRLNPNICLLIHSFSSYVIN